MRLSKMIGRHTETGRGQWISGGSQSWNIAARRVGFNFVIQWVAGMPYGGMPKSAELTRGAVTISRFGIL